MGMQPGGKACISVSVNLLKNKCVTTCQQELALTSPPLLCYNHICARQRLGPSAPCQPSTSFYRPSHEALCTSGSNSMLHTDGLAMAPSGSGFIIL